MKRTSGVLLFITGTLLILAPVIFHAIASERDKERIAQFYRNNPNNALVPEELKTSNYSGYDWACFGIGVGIAFTGVSQMKRTDATIPEKSPSVLPEI